MLRNVSSFLLLLLFINVKLEDNTEAGRKIVDSAWFVARSNTARELCQPQSPEEKRVKKLKGAKKGVPLRGTELQG